MTTQLNKEIAISEAGMLFNPSTGESFSVNPIGVKILGYLREGKSIKEISAALAEEYTTELETAERDVLDFISLLKHYQLVLTNVK